jgi:hypothetical protein
MGSIVAGMIDRCKEKGDRFPFYMHSAAVKAVKFQIAANESARKIISGSHCNQKW